MDKAVKVKDRRGSSEPLSSKSDVFKSIADISNDIIIVIQGNRFKYVNLTGLNLFGYTEDEMLSFNVMDILSPDCRALYLDNQQKTMAGKDVPPYELDIQCRNEKYIKLSCEHTLSKHVDEPALIITSRFISSEDTNQEQEALMLAAAVKSLHSAITITDMNRKITYVNQAHKNIFGYDPDELIGKQSNILYPFDDPSGISKKIYDAILMVGWQGERLGVRKNGQVFAAYEKTSVVKDQDGDKVGIVSVVDDISNRKKLEQALKESEERYRTLIETAKSSIIAVDEDNKILLANPSAEKLFGFTTEEFKEKEFEQLISSRYRDVYRSVVIDSENPALTSKHGQSYELYGLTKDGIEFPIEVSFSSCKIEGARIITAIIFDITERKNLQEQLVQSAKLAAVGELISGVTHEVNNPLAIVIGYSEMVLSESKLDEDTQTSLKLINSQAEQARKVIQNLLSFARKHELEKQLININDVVHNTLHLTDYELKKNKITTEKDLDPDIPLVLGDPNQLQQVFLNLIINAEHAMDETDHDNYIKIVTRVKPENHKSTDSEEDRIQIIFEDTGPGISENNLQKIFDPFFTTKPSGKGTGLGLSVSFGIIKDHNGEIFAESIEGQGTKFIIELPVTKSDKTSNETDTAAEQTDSETPDPN